MPTRRSLCLVHDLSDAAESAARLRALLEALQDRAEALQPRGLPVEPGRVAARRLAMLKAHERRIGSR